MATQVVGTQRTSRPGGIRGSFDALPTRRAGQPVDLRRHVSPDYPVLLFRPPYGELDLRPAFPEFGGSGALAGGVLGVQVCRPRVDLYALRAFLRDLIHRRPEVPVVVLLQMPPEEAVLAAARLAALRCRAVIRLGPELPTILREVLTDPATLGRDVVDWLRLRSIRPSPNQADLLERIFTDAPNHSELATLLGDQHISPSSARARLRKRGLPPPSRWLQAARAIHAALRIQARPEASVTAIALQLGFTDHSALVHLLRRSLGVSVRQIRGTLGWEWLLDRWLRSNRVIPR
ncbi:MAG: helix-turn-helix domain-containing protein [Gemmatimonas sp.]|nr:helix-turn-helix domain-containing protein [Gemmatimonas sp.]